MGNGGESMFSRRDELFRVLIWFNAFSGPVWIQILQFRTDLVKLGGEILYSFVSILTSCCLPIIICPPGERKKSENTLNHASKPPTSFCWNGHTGGLITVISMNLQPSPKWHRALLGDYRYSFRAMHLPCRFDPEVSGDTWMIFRIPVWS